MTEGTKANDDTYASARQAPLFFQSKLGLWTNTVGLFLLRGRNVRS